MRQISVNRFTVFVTLGVVFGIAFFVFSAIAQGPDRPGGPPDIDFPIAELGNCGSENECFEYCNSPGNLESCLDFGVRNNLMSVQEAEEARAEGFLDISGPGGCENGRECHAYCEEPENRNECLDFAVEEGEMSAEEAERIKQMPLTGPGGCRGRAECDAYCSNPDNGEECFNFGVEHGLIPPEEAERIKEGRGRGMIDGPGGCRGRAECDAYCNNPDNGEECIQFSVDHGFMSAQEAEQIRAKINFSGPGGCRGEAECHAYCEDPNHHEECVQVAVEQGFVDPSELEKFKRSQEFSRELNEQGGPGGCTSDETCKLYCSDPNNVEECINFAVDRGDLRPEDGRRELEKFRGGGFDDYEKKFEDHRDRFEKEFKHEREEFLKQVEKFEGDFKEDFRQRALEFEEKIRREKEEFRNKFRPDNDFGPPDEFPSGPREEFPNFPGFDEDGNFPTDGPGFFPGEEHDGSFSDRPPESFPGFNKEGDFPGIPGGDNFRDEFEHFDGPPPFESRDDFKEFNSFTPQGELDEFIPPVREFPPNDFPPADSFIEFDTTHPDDFTKFESSDSSDSFVPPSEEFQLPPPEEFTTFENFEEPTSEQLPATEDFLPSPEPTPDSTTNNEPPPDLTGAVIKNLPPVIINFFQFR